MNAEARIVRRRMVVAPLVLSFVASASIPAVAREKAPRSIGIPTRVATGWSEVPVFDGPTSTEPRVTLGGPEHREGVEPVVLVNGNVVEGRVPVLLPVRSQDASFAQSGWVAVDALRIEPALYEIHIDRTRHRLTVKKGGRVVRSMKAAVGRSETPTPALLTFVVSIARPIESRSDASALGPFSMRLAAWSPVLVDYSVDGSWDGIVIHGTNCPNSCLGRSVTNGSVRVSNENITWLARRIPAGTPVAIT